MSRRNAPEYVVALDVGTSRVSALIAEVRPDGGLQITGVGSQPTKGLKKGVVVNIEATVDAIRRAVEQAELTANCHVRAVHVGVSGSHVRSLNSVGVVPIRHRDITARDVANVIEAASAVAIPADLAPIGEFVDVIAGPAYGNHLSATVAGATPALML